MTNKLTIIMLVASTLTLMSLGTLADSNNPTKDQCDSFMKAYPIPSPSQFINLNELSEWAPLTNSDQQQTLQSCLTQCDLFPLQTSTSKSTTVSSCTQQLSTLNFLYYYLKADPQGGSSSLSSTNSLSSTPPTTNSLSSTPPTTPQGMQQTTPSPTQPTVSYPQQKTAPKPSSNTIHW